MMIVRDGHEPPINSEAVKAMLFLLGRRQPFVVAKDQLALLSLLFLFARLWNRRDQFGAAPALDGRLIGRLAVLIQDMV
jgi:hypothetical protein